MLRSFRTIFVYFVFLAALAAHAVPITGSVEIANANARFLSDIEVTLYEATNGAPNVLGTALTDENGNFVIDSAVTTTNGTFYLKADVRRRVVFLTVLGTQLPDHAVINEITTVGSCYAMAQFMRTGVISGDPFRLYLASEMYTNIADSATGAISDVLLSSPNADQTNSLRMVRTLANVVNRSATNPYVALYFLIYTRPQGGDVPADISVGLANLARDPGYRASQIYRLGRHRPVFEPILGEAPDAWCVTVKVNSSGQDDELGFPAGPANVAFDEWGYAWIPNNVHQGQTTSARFLICLQPNGKPADGTNGSPVSPIRGGGIYGGGWGVTVNSMQEVYVANFGWGGSDYWPDETDFGPLANGSVSKINAEDGAILSNPNGLFGGVWRAQAVAADPGDNIWVASFQNDRIVFWPDGDPSQFTYLDQYEKATPFGVYPISERKCWVANSGGLKGEFQSSVALVELDSNDVPQYRFLIPVGKTLRVIVTDSSGIAWVASNGDSSVYAISDDGQILGQYTGVGGLDGPWGIAVDGEDNVWVANFGPIESDTDFTPGRISKLAGSNPDTWPRPRMKMGDAISPETGYTVRSEGEQVLLADGVTPLYGDGGPPSFTPMMRQTSLQIDAAGNIWSINNWKPDANIDFATNPGGDGVVIFVGIAPPPAN